MAKRKIYILADHKWGLQTRKDIEANNDENRRQD